MRTRLLALALAAVAAGSLAPAATAGEQYDRQCARAVDSRCYHDFCGIIDCIRRDCVVYIGVFGDGNAAYCYGEDRPRGGGEDS